MKPSLQNGGIQLNVTAIPSDVIRVYQRSADIVYEVDRMSKSKNRYRVRRIDCVGGTINVVYPASPAVAAELTAVSEFIHNQLHLDPNGWELEVTGLPPRATVMDADWVMEMAFGDVFEES